MNDWKRDLEKINIVKRCPKCNSLSLVHIKGKIKCTNCGFEQDIPDLG